MSSDLVPSEGERSLDRFEASLAAERGAERTLMRSIAKMIVIGTPIGIIFFMALLALAIGGKTEWYVIVGLGGGLGVLAAVLFGMLGGVTLNAHALEEIDRGNTGHSSHVEPS
jgi:4-hydroxybenzoate polyprenyltransferase